MPDTTTTLVTSNATDVAFDRDQTRLFVTKGSTIEVYDLASHSLIATWSIGGSLGPLSLSEDGSFLLVADTRLPALYRVSTASGVVTDTYIGTGNAYTDVEIVSATKVIVSSTDQYSQAQPLLFDLSTQSYTKLAAGNYTAGRQTFNEDQHLTLVTDGNSSGGPLHLFDDRTGTFTANGASGNFNYGVQAISEAAGLVAVGVYSQGIQLYDLSLKYLRTINLGNVSGIAFDASGKFIYVTEVAFSSTGYQATIVKYDAKLFNEIARYPVENSTQTNSSNVRYGDNLLVSGDGRFVVSTDPSTGKVIVIDTVGATQLSTLVHHDFNGDGHGDVLLQSTTGALTVWQGQSDGHFIANTNVAANQLDANWKVAGLGDFNGDGREDILWRHASGEIGEWTGQAGQFTNNGGAAANQVDNSWSVAGVADFNGDGRADILWRHTSGEIGEWTAKADGSFANNGGAAANVVDTSWSIVASGDFNGDGKADILWRHSSGVYAEWQGSSTGKLTNAGGVLSGAMGTVVGSGDFNGDGRDDILMRNATSGELTVWLGQGNGQFSGKVPAAQVTDLNWKIVGIGDYNGDGRDDLIWKHSSGAGAEWLGTATGDFINNGATPITPVGYAVQSPDVWLV